MSVYTIAVPNLIICIINNPTSGIDSRFKIALFNVLKKIKSVHLHTQYVAIPSQIPSTQNAAL